MDGGLREDQAAAALAALTDGRFVSLINAPAGSGKTRVLAEITRIWAASGGEVIGITPSQSARNTLAAGVPVSYNAAQFLGHLPGRRGARGPVPIGPGTLLVIDEASMLSGPDLADLIAYAKACGAKIILAGDISQLQAVENGGGMSLLATRLGYARLAEPVRFRHPWEQHASLRLRDGDTTVLAEYDQHGRIIGGDPEQTMDAAAAAYVALTTNGTDTLLMAADHALRRELNRRIRDDLITLRIVSHGPAVTIADGTRASPGDLIICTRNDHSVEAGEPGRTLANGDLLRIEAITRDGLLVRRALDADPRTGQRRWTDRHFVFKKYNDAELGYAVTDHAAQGRTVHTGLTVITGTEDRQHAYVALSRGTDVNLAYVFTASPKTADPVPGPRPAPELARYDRRAATPGGPAIPAAAAPGEALTVLAGVLDRDGQLLSATQTRHQALADADHLAILHAIWAAETSPPGTSATAICYERPAARLPPATRPPGEVAVADPARRRAGRSGPRPDPGRRYRRTGPGRIPRYRRRPRRPHQPPPRHPSPAPAPAVVRSGPRPRRPRAPRLRRRDRRADGRPQGPDRRARRRPPSALGHQHARTGPRPPAGPARMAETSCLDRRLAGTVRLQRSRRPDRPRARRGRPDARAAWHEALAVLGPADGPDVRGMPDGRLLHLRDTYPVETAWAPRYVRDELRQVRAAAWDARLAGLRAAAEARAAEQHGDHDNAMSKHKLAVGYQALEQAYRQRETVFATVMADRTEWDYTTRAQRQLAVAADAELRRRHPGQYYAPLRSAEPEPATAAQREELTATAGEQPGEMGQWIKDLAAGHRTFAGRLADRQSQTIPSEDPEYDDLGRAFPAWPAQARAAILQPPMPEIPPSRKSCSTRRTATPTGKPLTDWSHPC